MKAFLPITAHDHHPVVVAAGVRLGRHGLVHREPILPVEEILPYHEAQSVKQKLPLHLFFAPFRKPVSCSRPGSFCRGAG